MDDLSKLIQRLMTSGGTLGDASGGYAGQISRRNLRRRLRHLSAHFFPDGTIGGAWANSLGRFSPTAPLAAHAASTWARSFPMARSAVRRANTSGKSSPTKRLDGCPLFPPERSRRDLFARTSNTAIPEQFHVNRDNRRTPTPPPALLAPLRARRRVANRISPTDVSQFVRLEQCERLLPVRLADVRARNHGGLRRRPPGHSASADPCGKPVRGPRRKGGGRPLLPRRTWPRRRGTGGKRPANNQDLAQLARQLTPGSVLVLFQPRLELEVEGWLIRGDADMSHSAGRRRQAGRAHHRHEEHHHGQGRAPVAGGFLPPHAHENFSSARASLPFESGLQSSTGASRSRGAHRRRAAELQHREAARQWFGLDDALLEVAADTEAYLQAVLDDVTGPESAAPRVSGPPVRTGSICPFLQVRRLPVQRVLPEVDRPERRLITPAAPERGREAGASKAQGSRPCVTWPCSRISANSPRLRVGSGQGHTPLAHTRERAGGERRRRAKLPAPPAGPRARTGQGGAGASPGNDLAGGPPVGRACPSCPRLPPPRREGAAGRPQLYPVQRLRFAAAQRRGTELEPRSRLYRRPARLSARPRLPGRRPGSRPAKPAWPGGRGPSSTSRTARRKTQPKIETAGQPEPGPAPGGRRSGLSPMRRAAAVPPST